MAGGQLLKRAVRQGAAPKVMGSSTVMVIFQTHTALFSSSPPVMRSCCSSGWPKA